MVHSGALGKLIHEKNLKSKIRRLEVEDQYKEEEGAKRYFFDLEDCAHFFTCP
jgi:hypothetical protein